MNILHVCSTYYPSVGGPQYTMKHVSEKLAAYYNDTVKVCTTNSLYAPESKLFEKIGPSVELINDVEIHRLPFNRWHYPLITVGGKVYGKLLNKPLPFSIVKHKWGIDSPAIDRMMKRSTAEVIMATTIVYNFADYPLWRLRTRNPKPFVLYGAIHLHKPLPADSPLITRAKACDCYIANTNYEKQQLINYGVDAGKIVTIGTGISIEDLQCSKEQVAAFRKQNGIEEGDTVIGFIGRLVKGKGVAILIEALRKLAPQNKKLKLLLAGGTTEYTGEIRKAIAEGLPIILIENFEEKEKAVIYNALDVFVLASQSESFGVVFLEAWSCKKPVVGTRMGAIESLLSEGKDSLLYEPSSVDSLAAQIQKLVSDENLRQQLGEAGYAKVEQHFTWPRIVEKYRNAYQQGIETFNKQYSEQSRSTATRL